MYEQIYSLCQNIEGVMDMFSEELRIMDRNTVRLMIDEQQEEIERLAANNKLLTASNEQLTTSNKQLLMRITELENALSQ